MSASAAKVVAEGKIEFLGLWQDTGDRAMPIKMNVSPDDPNQIYRAFDELVAEMKRGGVTSGIIAAQSYNQMHWSANPHEAGYKKHGFIGSNPDQAIRSSWSGREHREEGLRFDGFDGGIDVLGGDWQNAVYRVTLGRNDPTPGEGSIEIMVKDIKAGKEFRLDVDAGGTVDAIKAKIEKMEGIPAMKQRLIFGGMPLEDAKTLRDLGIQKGSKLQLVYKLDSTNESDLPAPRIFVTEMVGGHTGTQNSRAGSAKPRLIEWPSMAKLNGMSREQLESLRFTRIGWKARGGLDALKFWQNDGTESPFYGACPHLNGSAGHFGDLSNSYEVAQLGDSNIRGVTVFWYQHDVTGLALLGEGGRVIAQEGPGHCRDGFGQRTFTFGATEKLVGFKFYTDHCTPQLACIVADMGTPQGGGGGGAQVSGAVEMSVTTPQSLTVVGAGPWWANDTWSLSGTHNGKPRWARNGNPRDYIKYENNQWTINGTAGEFCYARGDLPVPPATGWAEGRSFGPPSRVEGGVEDQAPTGGVSTMAPVAYIAESGRRPSGAAS